MENASLKRPAVVLKAKSCFILQRFGQSVRPGVGGSSRLGPREGSSRCRRAEGSGRSGCGRTRHCQREPSRSSWFQPQPGKK